MQPYLTMQLVQVKKPSKQALTLITLGTSGSNSEGHMFLIWGGGGWVAKQKILGHALFTFLRLSNLDEINN